MFYRRLELVKTIYFVRHGETRFNLYHKVQGRCDSPLTELGIKQAKLVRDYFKKNSISFSQAFSSPQERACDTLEIITEHKMKYIRLDSLKEKDYGIFEGEPEYLLPWKYSNVEEYPGMESNAHVILRMHRSIERILGKLKDTENALVVSHGNIIGRYIYNEVSKDITLRMDNGSIFEVVYGDSSVSLKRYIHNMI